MRWRYQGRLEKDGWASAQSPFKRAARVYHVFMQLCIKLIIMEESTENFQTKVRMVQNVMALFQLR
jgi:hypothetical protein